MQAQCRAATAKLAGGCERSTSLIKSKTAGQTAASATAGCEIKLVKAAVTSSLISWEDSLPLPAVTSAGTAPAAHAAVAASTLQASQTPNTTKKNTDETIA
jgi:hypothetical protein